MRLSFNENTKEVYIEDRAASVHRNMKILSVLLIVSQILGLIDLDLNNISYIDYASMILLITCLGYAFYSFFKVTVKNKILLKGLKHKKGFTNITFNFKLKNGKIRTLTDTTSSSSETILSFCKSHNIPVL